MQFLHDGRPDGGAAGDVDRAASAASRIRNADNPQSPMPTARDTLLRILGSLNVCSKEWIIRQYDHEVQGGSVIKPLVGVGERRPGRRRRGPAGARLVARAGDRLRHQPALRRPRPVPHGGRRHRRGGAQLRRRRRRPERIAILDNFCWGNTDRPEMLGSLVRAAQACRDVALAYGTPFISGKDSLNNEFSYDDRTASGRRSSIPPTLLISALGQVADVRRCVTMDLKEAGQPALPGRRDEGRAGRLALRMVHERQRMPRATFLKSIRPSPNDFRRHAPGHQPASSRLPRPERRRPGVGAAEMAFAGGLGHGSGWPKAPRWLGDIELEPQALDCAKRELGPPHH